MIVIICILVFALCIVLVFCNRMYHDFEMISNKYYAENEKLKLVCYGVSETKSGIQNFFKSIPQNNIAIYGVGMIFEVYRKEITNNENGKLKVYIDQNDTRQDIDGIKIRKLNKVDEPIDLVILTVLFDTEQIVKNIQQKFGDDIKIMSITDMVYYK